MDSPTIFATILALVFGLLTGWFFTRRLLKAAPESEWSRETLNALEMKLALSRQESESRQHLLDELKKEQNFSLQVLSAEKEEQLEKKAEELRALRLQLEGVQNEKAEQQSITNVLKSSLREREDKLRELKEQFEDQKAGLKKEFKLISEELYKEKQQALVSQNRESVSALLDPLKEQLKGFQERVNTVHKEQVEGTAQLGQQISSLKGMNEALKNEAGNLARALRNDKKTLGNWGEVQVESLLENSGLQKNREYRREENFKNSEGENRRPDFVLYLPEKRHIIIDSKVSLNAYVDSVNSDDPAQVETHMAEYVKNVKAHILELSHKDYTSLEGVKSPDFVFMFMPMETAYLAAFQADPTLFQMAYERKIAVVTPNTLLPILRTVASLWNIEKQNSSTKDLATAASKVYKKLVIFAEKFNKVQGQLDTVVSSYQEARTTLTSGKGNLVKIAEGFKELGVTVNKSLPADLVDESRSALDLLSDEGGESLEKISES